MQNKCILDLENNVGSPEPFQMSIIASFVKKTSRILLPFLYHFVPLHIFFSEFLTSWYSNFTARQPKKTTNLILLFKEHFRNSK